MKRFLSLIGVILVLGTPALAEQKTAPETATSFIFSVIASSDHYRGYPDMGIVANGKVVATVPVTANHSANQWQAFTFKITVPGSPQTVGVSFLNDAYGDGANKDRNLYVKDIIVNGTTLLPSQGTYRGAAGTGALYWDGTLSWAIASLFNNPPVTAPPPPAACGSTPSGSTITQTVSTASGSIAATTAQCPYGGTQPTTTSVTQVELCTNGTLSAQGSTISTTTDSGSPSCKAAPSLAACGSTPSGSTMTQTVSTASGSIAATTAQCPYGGTQPTTTSVTQVELCTNGTLSAQGSTISTTTDSGSPSCKAAPSLAACGSTPSGSTITQTVSTASGSIAATTAQCPYGGTQPTTTSVTQVELCTNGTLSAQGSTISTTTDSGSPSCKAAPSLAACGSTPSGSTITQTVSTASGSIAATTAQCPYGGTQPTTTSVTQVELCTNGTLSAQGSTISTTTDAGSPSCNEAPSVNGSCGTANGVAVSTAPTTNLCSSGTSSAVSGSGPWAWSCAGSNGGTSAQCAAPLSNSSCIAGNALSGIPAIIMPPSVPQPSQSGDIVGVILQNMSSSALTTQYITFGQIFANGAVEPGDNLVARIFGNNYPAQMDALALWPNGSVKLAAITVGAGNICAGTQIPAVIAEAPEAPANTTPVSLTLAPVTLNVNLDFTSGGTSQTINLGSALKLALSQAPNYWLQGPLATQARVDLPVTGTPTMHITADVTAYADGSIQADVQFNNDITTTIPMAYGGNNQQSPLPMLKYTATVSLQNQQTSNTVSQDQYTDWHVVLSSTGMTPMNVSANGSVALNIQHDVAYLEHTGAILSYDRTTGVDNATIQNYAGEASNTPLAINGVTTYMPTTGGRGDIGYTTQYNTVWLLTGDARAAAVGLAQSDTSGAVPWNMKLANGHWLTPYDDTNVWTSSDEWSDSILNAIDTSVWMPDPAHEPNLNYVPYIMTGARWNLDRLNAQAAFGLSDDYPGYRCKPNTNNCTNPTFSDIVLNGDDQVRYQGWSLRELKEASFIGAPGSFEESYFTKAVTDNWSYVQSQEPAWAAAEGQATGWLPGAYGSSANGAIAPWEEDYLEGVVNLSSEMGDTGAQQFLAWQHPWLTGRFNVPSSVDMNPNDGCVYNLVTFNGSTGVAYTTWTAIEAATVAAGLSQGTAFNALTNGDYCPLARAALGGALTMNPGDAELTQALSWLDSQVPTATWLSYFQQDPTFNVVPLQ